MALAFDTLTTADELQKGGFTEPQARSIAKLVHNQLVGNVATKDDIAAVRTELKDDIAAVRTELKEDIAELRAELKSEMVTKHELTAAINGLESRLLKTLVPTIFGMGALLFAALRFLPPV